jgi:hypothetical protein
VAPDDYVSVASPRADCPVSPKVESRLSLRQRSTNSRANNVASGERQLRAGLPAIFAHGITSHLNPVGVVDQPVENAVGERGIADLLVPTGNWQPRSQDGRVHLITVFADLPEITTLGF